MSHSDGSHRRPLFFSAIARKTFSCNQLAVPGCPISEGNLCVHCESTTVPPVSPERTCVGCRQVDEQAELLRLALDPISGAVVLDAPRRLGGRGAYVHCRRDCIDHAIRRRALPRALRVPGCDIAVLSDLKLRLCDSLTKA